MDHTHAHIPYFILNCAHTNICLIAEKLCLNDVKIFKAIVENK